MRDEVNKNGSAKNKYFLIKPPLLRTLHDCNVIDIVKSDNGNSYASPFTYVFLTLPPTDTPNTISAFLNH